MRLRKLIGTLEKFNEDAYHPTLAKSIVLLDSSLTDSNSRLYEKAKVQAQGTSKQFSKQVSKQLYKYCSKQNTPVTHVIQNASEEVGTTEKDLRDDELLDYISE